MKQTRAQRRKTRDKGCAPLLHSQDTQGENLELGLMPEPFYNDDQMFIEMTVFLT